VLLFLICLLICVRRRYNPRNRNRFDIDAAYGSPVKPSPNNQGAATAIPHNHYSQHPATTEQSHFPPTISEFPSQSTTIPSPFLLHHSPPFPSPQSHHGSAVWTSNSTTGLLQSPHLHHQSFSPSISSYSADSGGRSPRPMSSISQGSYPMPVASIGSSYVSREGIPEVPERSNPASGRPPGSDMEKPPIENYDELYRMQQAPAQSSSSRDATTDTAGASQWNAGEGTAQLITPDDAPPRYEALGL